VTPEVEAELRSLGYLGGSFPAKESYGPQDDPKNLIELDGKLHRMNGLYAAGRREEVVRLGREILAERPDLGLAATYLSQALLDLGRPQEAVQVLERARAAGGGNDTLLRQLGLALTWSGRAADAVALLEPTAQQAGPATLNVLGAALVRSGQPARGAEVLERVFAVDPTNARACENLSAAAIARELWGEAAEWAERALELNRKLPNAWNNLGVARYYLGDGPGALEAWQRALELNPRQFDTLFNLGLKAAELGEIDLARRALGRFLESAPPANYAPALEQARRLLAQLESGAG
jgi:tetratricopeptide (TPR) repeat protein